MSDQVQLTPDERQLVASILSMWKPHLSNQLWVLELGGHLFYVRQDEWPLCEIFGWLRPRLGGNSEWVLMGRRETFRGARRFVEGWLGLPPVMGVQKLRMPDYTFVRNMLTGELWCEFADHPGQWLVP